MASPPPAFIAAARMFFRALDHSHKSPFVRLGEAAPSPPYPFVRLGEAAPSPPPSSRSSSLATALSPLIQRWARRLGSRLPSACFDAIASNVVSMRLRALHRGSDFKEMAEEGGTLLREVGLQRVGRRFMDYSFLPQGRRHILDGSTSPSPFAVQLYTVMPRRPGLFHQITSNQPWAKKRHYSSGVPRITAAGEQKKCMLGDDKDPLIVTAFQELLCMNADFIRSTWQKMNKNERLAFWQFSWSAICIGTCGAAALFFNWHERKVREEALVLAGNIKAKRSASNEMSKKELDAARSQISSHSSEIRKLKKLMAQQAKEISQLKKEQVPNYVKQNPDHLNNKRVKHEKSHDKLDVPDESSNCEDFNSAHDRLKKRVNVVDVEVEEKDKGTWKLWRMFEAINSALTGKKSDSSMNDVPKESKSKCQDPKVSVENDVPEESKSKCQDPKLSVEIGEELVNEKISNTEEDKIGEELVNEKISNTEEDKRGTCRHGYRSASSSLQEPAARPWRSREQLAPAPPRVHSRPLLSRDPRCSAAALAAGLHLPATHTTVPAAGRLVKGPLERTILM